MNIEKVNSSEVIAQTLLVNNLTDNTFFITDAVSGEVKEWDVSFSNVNANWRLWGRQILILCCEGYNNAETQQLVARNSTYKSYVITTRRVIQWANEHLPDTPMTQWTEAHCRQLLIDALLKRTVISDHHSIKTDGLAGNGPIDEIFTLLSKSHRWYITGKLADGLPFNFPRNFLKTCLEPTLNADGQMFAKWSKGGGWKAVPIHLAMMLLSDAIDIIRHPTTKLLLVYFEHQRGPLKVALKSVFCDKLFERFCREGKHYRNWDTERFAALKKVLELSTGHVLDSFPLTQEAIKDHCVQVHDACLVVLLTLTGIRISEVASISGDDYKVEPDGTWVFKSDLDKTNFGLSEVRTMSGLVAEAANVLCGLSYVTKRKRTDAQSLPLLGRYYFKHDYNTDETVRNIPRTVAAQSLRYRLNKFYDAFAKRHGNEIRELRASVHPHAFRHTFVEFALRRFDGNILEAIRQHFRHRADSYFTRRYTDNKLSDELRATLEREYLKEILGRMVSGKETDDFIGPIAAYVKRQVQNMLMVTPSEVDDFIDDLSDEFESIIAHEYGFCLVRKATRHLAKCLDKQTGLPVVLKGCFELCSGCPHSLHSKQSNRENIIRIAVSHNDLLGHYPIKNTTAHKESAAIIERANKILEQMEVI